MSPRTALKHLEREWRDEPDAGDDDAPLTPEQLHDLGLEAPAGKEGE